MHHEASSWVSWCVAAFDLHGDVLEFGGRYVNGGVRDLIPHDHWLSVDLRSGDGVDVVGNAATVDCGYEGWDVVVSTELLEHTPEGEAICANAYRHLCNGGWLVMTMAGPGRAPHGASGEPRPPAGEHYGNVEPDVLKAWLFAAGFRVFELNTLGTDLRCVARRGAWPSQPSAS